MDNDCEDDLSMLYRLLRKVSALDLCVKHFREYVKVNDLHDNINCILKWKQSLTERRHIHSPKETRCCGSWSDFNDSQFQEENRHHHGSQLWRRRAIFRSTTRWIWLLYQFQGESHNKIIGSLYRLFIEKLWPGKDIQMVSKKVFAKNDPRWMNINWKRAWNKELLYSGKMFSI